MKRILVTRPRLQADAFIEGLKAAGLEPICFPVIQIRPMEDNTRLDQALAHLSQYDWIVFTSVNAVDVVFGRLPAGAQMPRIAAIGPKTAEALRAHGVVPDFVPSEYVAESILPGLGELHGKKILLPRAEIARKALPEAITAAGGIAYEIAVYQTLPEKPNATGLEALRSGVDWITFTSPSTVQNFVEIIRRQKLDPFHLPGAPKIACIGPITEKAARDEGFEVAQVAKEYTTDGLIQTIRNAQSESRR